MKHSILLTIVIFFASISIFGQDVKFTAQARNAVLAGEKFQLVYSVNKEGEDLRLPPLNNFTVLMGPSVMTSSSTQIIGGKVTRNQEYSYTYILKCDTPGKYTLASAQINIDGKKYESNPVSIEVVKNEGTRPQQQNSTQESESSNFSKDDLFIKVSKNKSSIYIGEPVVLTTKIYTRINLDNISDIKHPDYRNFIVQDIEDGNNIQWSYEFVNNKQYRVGTFERKVLYAQKTGKQTIEPTEIEFLIKQRVRRRSNSIFDDFFDNNYRVVKKRVSSQALSINVKPYPTAKPKSFSGGVGNLTMNVTTSQNKVKVNDGVTIKVVIAGTGNHKLISVPEFNFSTDFDTFDPTTKNNFTNTVSGMKGSKTFEYLIIPRFGGTYTIDPLVFSYFDPKSEKFVTLKSDPIVIEVEKGSEEQTGSTYIPSSVNREDVKFIGKDIRFIKTDNTKLKEKGTYLFGSLIFYLGYIIPIILFALAYFLNKKKIHENANVQLVKNKKANKMARKRLKKSSVYLKDKNHEAFYNEVLKALYSYLSDKLFLPVSELSKEKATDLIIKRGVSEEVKNELIEILDTCEFARFSPSSGEAQEMDKLYNKALENISKLDSQIK
ncbi:BatD family protein [Plebeiibacterium marinum]|uniref:BatD family protein n=1 Tax=Plebeiibacterium marinum TaxID=2992111 RepID=A0AAE3MBW5_9BACT|nr:BatD family protein [Plebeiobacterium marinum]MCW3804883.1 BatD family protein [Plebeiobacterium marinum]